MSRWHGRPAPQRGHRGGVIAPHRSILTLHLTESRAVYGSVAAAALAVLWLVFLNPMARVWAGMLGFWSGLIGLDGRPELVTHVIAGGAWTLTFPRLDAGAAPLTHGIWWTGLIATLVALVVSYLLPRRWLPFLYLLRTAVIVQGSAQLFFAIAPGAFPYDIGGYTEVLLTAGMMLIGIVPLLFGLTYFTLDYGRLRKVAIVLLAMAHLAVFIPMQFVAHAWLLQHGSLLLMPLLFWMFGLPLDVGVMIGFYAWAVSWKPLPPERAPHVRGWRPAAAAAALAASAALLALLFVRPVHAQESEWTRLGEAGAGAGWYTEGLGRADDQFARLTLTRPYAEAWRFDVARASRFAETAAGAGVSYKRWLARRLAVSAGLSGGTGEVLFPRYRLDAGVEVALRADGALLANLGVHRAQSHAENHVDGTAFGLSYWFPGPWVASAGGRIEVGYPGRTTSRWAGVGLTYARYKSFYLGAELGAGETAYILLAPGEAFVDYWTRSAALTSSLYFGPALGVNARFEYADTELYDRRSITLSVFREW